MAKIPARTREAKRYHHGLPGMHGNCRKAGCGGSESRPFGTGIALQAMSEFERQTMFDTLNWDDLRVFLYAARAGNLSQTAKKLRLDHSTVSRRIAQNYGWAWVSTGAFYRGLARVAT